MERLYDNTAISRRSNISLAILIPIFAYGIWELWHAATVSGDKAAYIYGIIFVGGALYGLRTMLAETRDLVVAFDADLTSRHAMMLLWRPFRMKRIDTELEQITGWRHRVSTESRGRRTFFLLADEPSHKDALRFELHAGIEVGEELRGIAPDAIADFVSASDTSAGQ